MRRDVQTCKYLMPYIIHNVLEFGAEEGRQQVKCEIEAVLRGGHMHKEGELCVQAIFSLLDVLKKWAMDHLDQANREESSAGEALRSYIIAAMKKIRAIGRDIENVKAAYWRICQPIQTSMKTNYGVAHRVLYPRQVRRNRSPIAVHLARAILFVRCEHYSLITSCKLQL